MSTANALALIAIANDIAALIVNGSQAFSAVQATLARAQAEGRDVTPEELDAARLARLQVLGDLDAEIARRRQQPPG